MGEVRVGGGQGGWERRIKVFVKIQKKLFGGGGGLGGVGVGLGGGQGGCDRRIEVFGKIHKKFFFFGWGGIGLGRGGGGSGWMSNQSQILFSINP